VKAMSGKLFSVHLDFIVNEKNVVRMSFSNIFKEKKVSPCLNVQNIAGNAIQIPLELPTQWTVLHI
jgi:hypothetical protein